MSFSGRMAGVNGDRKGKKDDNGIGTAIDFMLSNAKLVLGVGGAAMLGIATLAVKRVSVCTRGNQPPSCIIISNDPCCLCRCMTVPWALPPALPRWKRRERGAGRSLPGWGRRHESWTTTWSPQSAGLSSPCPLPHILLNLVSETLTVFKCHRLKFTSNRVKLVSVLGLVTAACFYLLTDGLLGAILLFLYSGCWSFISLQFRYCF